MLLDQITGLLSTPSKKSWLAICALLEGWPAGAERDEALRRADAALEEWPEKGLSMLSGWPTPNRVAPEPWCRRLQKQGTVPPGWSLVRFLQYHDTWLTEADLARILDSGQLSRLTHLYLGMTGLKPGVLGALADAADGLTALRAISVYGNTVAGDRMADLLARLGGRLTYLNLGASGVGNREVEAITAAGNLTGLRGLDLETCRFDGAALDALMQCSGLPALEVLKLSESGYRAAKVTHNHEERAQERGHRHLRRAAWAGTLSRQSIPALQERLRAAGLPGASGKNRHSLVERLLVHWDATHG